MSCSLDGLSTCGIVALTSWGVTLMNNKMWALAGAFVCCFGLQSGAQAQTCGGVYRVQGGDSLSLIADSQYKNAGYWTAIHQNNIAKIGQSPNNISVGMKLDLLCIDGLPVGLEGGVEVATAAAPAAPLVVEPGTAASAKKINFLTADDYAPFTDRKALNGGLVTEVVQKAMEKAAPAEGFAIHWVNDWSAHLEPLLSNALLDLGFPWLKPDCVATPDNYRCANFHFSDSMFEMLVLVFVAKDRPIAFTKDDDMLGKTLCRPKGYYTHDLDKDGRNWLAEGKIKLEMPDKNADCFNMLLAGTVDAVVVDEFTGRATMKELNIGDKVEVVQSRPLSIEGLHVVVHKSHPRADELLGLINKGLADIKADGTYQQVIGPHMQLIWADF
jgi:polar amino acid transport system substrate-binding protein